MKTIFYIVSALILLSSCNSKKEEIILLNDTKNTENIYGVLNIKLGVTTVKEMSLNSFDITFNDPFYKLIINNDNDIDYSSYLTILNDYLNQKNIKRYFFDKYSYNDITINNLELFFLNDTLITINIYTDRQYNYFYKKDKTRFIDIFINKYGNGIGKINKTTENENSFSKENRVWENSKIKVEYNEVSNDNLDDIRYFSLINYYSGTLSYKLINKYPTDSLLTKEAAKLLVDLYVNNIEKEKQKKLDHIKSNI